MVLAVSKIQRETGFPEITYILQGIKIYLQAWYVKTSHAVRSGVPTY